MSNIKFTNKISYLTVERPFRLEDIRIENALLGAIYVRGGIKIKRRQNDRREGFVKRWIRIVINGRDYLTLNILILNSSTIFCQDRPVEKNIF